MRSLFHGLLICLAVSCGLLAQAPAANRAEPIRGQVVSAADGVPLRRARVVVTAGERRLDAVATDDEGRFRIDGAPATPLTVRVTKAGYAPGLVDVPAAGGDAELRFSLPRSAAVTGRVLDRYGAPVVGSFVIGRLILPAGDKTPEVSRRFVTMPNGLGDYRLGSLWPGRYEITAERFPPETRAAEKRIFGPTSSLKVAGGDSTIVLSAGDEIQGVDFTMADSAFTCPTGPSRKPPEGVVMASIAGRVTDASGEPIGCVGVWLVGSDVAVPGVFTDPQGRYSIEGLRAGSYILNARKNGYLTLQYGQRSPSDAEAPIVLVDTEQRTRVDFVLPRDSAIRGTVVDEHGEPVEGLRVAAFRLRRVDGQISPKLGELPTYTDDRGQYVLNGLDPGSYVVGTMTRDVMSSDGSRPARTYLSGYYPGTPDPLTAQPIVLDAGRHLDGIDLAYAPTRTVTISGSALDSAGRPLAGSVHVTASGPSAAFSLDSASAPIDASGRFVLRHVLPNRDYVVKALGPNRRQFGMQHVTVGEDDPPQVTVTAYGGATVDGSLTVEGADSPDGLGITVTAVPTDSDLSPDLPGSHDGFDDGVTSTLKGGRFHIEGATGPTRFLVTIPCESCYLRSVLVNGTNATDTPFDLGLTGVYRDVDIVVSDAGAAIEGRATAERDAPATAFWAVVFPTSRDLWYARSPHVKAGQSTQDGSFRVDGLAPGEYFVAAVNRFEPPTRFGGGEFADSEVLEQLAKQAERVTLSERDRRTMTLRLIRR